ncbi:WecB/TagA/CpsF family glycosyltransferase [Polaromonas sp.]|uniref:WecB/TagA/CpsF family glycosyltransferase n=1 Tax=Polaromonas sp. TaxID=1869339 RepID=UPI0032651EF4
MLNISFDSPADWRERWALLVQKIERVQSPVDSQALLASLAHPARPLVLAFANAHAMNSMVASVPFFEAMRSADLVLRDGSGMATLFRLLRMQPGLNLNGTDFIPQLIRAFDGRRIALFGTRDPYLAKARLRVQQDLAPHSQTITAHGFLDVEAYALLAVQHQPALIVLGMGMPRQEEVAARLRGLLDFPCLIVCGGAILDFLGDKTPRAPLWMQKAGMEWLFRLALEPRRLFQRYVIGNPLFLTRALRLASLNRR